MTDILPITIRVFTSIQISLQEKNMTILMSNEMSKGLVLFSRLRSTEKLQEKFFVLKYLYL